MYDNDVIKLVFSFDNIIYKLCYLSNEYKDYTLELCDDGDYYLRKIIN